MRQIAAPLLLLTLTVIPVLAQLRYRPTENGPWRPWSFTAIASARQARAASPAEVQAWQVRLQELGAIVRRAPAVSQPVGFAAEMWGNLDGYGPPEAGEPAGSRIPLAGSLSFGAFPLIEFMRNGKLVNEDLKGGETQLLLFTINQIGRDLFSAGRPSEWSGQEAPGFVQPTQGESLPGGLTRYGDIFVLPSEKNANRPLWFPLPLAEALSPVVAQRRALFENRRDNYARQKREFDVWLTPAKRAERRTGWQQAAATMSPDQGRAFLANMEKADVEIEAHNRRTLAPGGPEERGVQEAERDLREAEALPATSAPSCFDHTAGALAARIRPLAAAPPSCQPLVKTNWAFFDSTRPRSAPQILAISHFARCVTKEALAAPETTRGGCVINRQLLQSLDWDAVRAWLNR